MKYEFKGTQGKWHAVEYSGTIAIQDAPFYGEKDLLDADNVGYETMTANGYLAAAAPQLLQACVADVRNKYDNGIHVGYEVVGLNDEVLDTFDLNDFDHACQYIESLKTQAIHSALNIKK